MNDSPREPDPYAPDPDRFDPYAPTPEPEGDDGDFEAYELSDEAAKPAAESPTPTPHPARVVATDVACTHCGYNLTGVAIGSNCPECGAPVDPSLLITAKPVSGYAVTSMVLGIISLALLVFMLCCIPPVLSLPMSMVGLVFWHLARKPIRDAQVSKGSYGMNLTGLICNLAALIISLIIVIGFAALIIFSEASSSTQFGPTPIPPTTVTPAPSP